jgi:hypothetical protein
MDAEAKGLGQHHVGSWEDRAGERNEERAAEEWERMRVV